MPRCKCCGDWIAGEWVDHIVAVVALILCILFVLAAQGCATTSLVTPAGVNATTSALLYCPQAVVIDIRGENARLSVDESGVGETVQSLGKNAVEVLKP